MAKTVDSSPSCGDGSARSLPSAAATAGTSDEGGTTLYDEPHSTPLIGTTYRRAGPESQQRTIFMGHGYSATYGEADTIPDTDTAFVAQMNEVKKARDSLRRRMSVPVKRDYSYERDVEMTRRLGRVDLDEVERIRADVAFAKYYFDQPFVVRALEKHAGHAREGNDDGDDLSDDSKENKSPAIAHAPPSTPAPAWPEVEPKLMLGGEVKTNGSAVDKFAVEAHSAADVDETVLAANGSPVATRKARRAAFGAKPQPAPYVESVSDSDEQYTTADRLENELHTSDGHCSTDNLRRSAKNSTSFDDLVSAAGGKLNAGAPYSAHDNREDDDNSPRLPISWTSVSSYTEWKKNLPQDDFSRPSNFDDEDEYETNYTTRRYFDLPEEEHHYYGPGS